MAVELPFTAQLLNSAVVLKFVSGTAALATNIALISTTAVVAVTE